MSRLEFSVASAVLRLVGLLASLLPFHADRVVLATARVSTLEGNLQHLEGAIRTLRPDLRISLLLEPYGYGLRTKIAYALRLMRGMVLVSTSRYVIVDNAYLPIHVAPHRRRTTVIQVWHAAGALKRFGLDTMRPPTEPEATFLHRYYDVVVTSGEASRKPWAAALRTPLERVLALGTPRTDAIVDATAVVAVRNSLLDAYPVLTDRRIVLYAPTFRGRGRDKRVAGALDARALRTALPVEYALVLKTHPNLDARAESKAGYDVVVDPASELNPWLVIADILITDYSSSIFEWALLRRPLVLLVDDLEAYERDPGLYVDYRRAMIGTQVPDTAGVAEAILTDDFDLAAYDAFIAHHLGPCDGAASRRVVETLLTD
ncbi:MAG TPA: CDP-glycerol glycerophosphotransferase family protein [Candidatus Saccharimonadia bacterium]|nr:CDP-glycerol glycerophosphotransferase family protein [Candidatus Saccharimonadia bacterium]